MVSESGQVEGKEVTRKTGQKNLKFLKEQQQKQIRESSICVKLLKKVEKPVIEEALAGLHAGIEKICFPRQKIPRFFFVRCCSSEVKSEVWKAIKKLKNDAIGPMQPKIVRPPVPKPKNVKNGHVTTNKKTIDPLTLVLEMIPKDLATEKIQKEFPDCKKASRFNDRRCYLYFSSIENAFEAFERLSSELILGHNISVRYRKVMNTTKRGKNMEKAVALEDESMSENAESNDEEDQSTSEEES